MVLRRRAKHDIALTWGRARRNGNRHADAAARRVADEHQALEVSGIANRNVEYDLSAIGQVQQLALRLREGLKNCWCGRAADLQVWRETLPSGPLAVSVHPPPEQPQRTDDGGPQADARRNRADQIGSQTYLACPPLAPIG